MWWSREDMGLSEYTACSGGSEGKRKHGVGFK